MATYRYPALIIQDPGDRPQDGYDVLFPDFPGCVSNGDTPEAATSAGTEALASHVDAMLRAGETLPVPSSRGTLPEWLRDTPMSIVARVEVPIEVPNTAMPATAISG